MQNDLYKGPSVRYASSLRLLRLHKSNINLVCGTGARSRDLADQLIPRGEPQCLVVVVPGVAVEEDRLADQVALALPVWCAADNLNMRWVTDAWKSVSFEMLTNIYMPNFGQSKQYVNVRERWVWWVESTSLLKISCIFFIKMILQECHVLSCEDAQSADAKPNKANEAEFALDISPSLAESTPQSIFPENWFWSGATPILGQKISLPSGQS